MGEIVAALATTHAPQLLVRPRATEDPEEVARTQAAMARLGAVLDASRAETLIIVALDHVENFLDQVVAPFVVYTGDEVEGEYFSHRARYRVDRDLAERLLSEGIDAGIDLAHSQSVLLDHSFVIPLRFVHPANTLPIVPIIVNAYVPPQPTPARCFSVGEALRASILRSGRRVALLASGGMSHYPGTPKYPHPDFDFDRRLLAALERGTGGGLREMSSKQLDDVGNLELRTWMLVMGIIGETRPATVLHYEPCWHHGHGVLSWDVGGTS